MTTVRITAKEHPISSEGEWKQHAPPKGGDLHWKDGRSAKELAKAWCPDGSGPAIPVDVLAVLESHPVFAGVRELDLVPEAHITFDSFSGPRNADLAGIGVDDHGRFVITVEAKADETFDQMVTNVVAKARETLQDNPRSKALDRVRDLLDAILPRGSDNAACRDKLRYQLLTATAGTLALAREKEIDRALFLVHEFVTAKTKDEKHEASAADLDFFVECLSSGTIKRVQQNEIVGPFHLDSSTLFGKPAALYVGKVVTCQRPSRYALPHAGRE